MKRVLGRNDFLAFNYIYRYCCCFCYWLLSVVIVDISCLLLLLLLLLDVVDVVVDLLICCCCLLMLLFLLFTCCSCLLFTIFKTHLRATQDTNSRVGQDGGPGGRPRCLPRPAAHAQQLCGQRPDSGKQEFRGLETGWDEKST